VVTFGIEAAHLFISGSMIAVSVRVADDELQIARVSFHIFLDYGSDSRGGMTASIITLVFYKYKLSAYRDPVSSKNARFSPKRRYKNGFS
jgi:hypothetical protein